MKIIAKTVAAVYDDLVHSYAESQSLNKIFGRTII